MMLSGWFKTALLMVPGINWLLQHARVSPLRVTCLLLSCNLMIVVMGDQKMAVSYRFVHPSYLAVLILMTMLRSC